MCNRNNVCQHQSNSSSFIHRLKEQLSDKTAANVDLLKTNKLLQRRVDRLEKKLRNATNYGKPRAKPTGVTVN